MTKVSFRSVFALAALLASAGCVTGGGDRKAETATPAFDEAIQVSMDNRSFLPDTLTLEAGKRYRIKVENISKTAHYFGSEEFGKGIELHEVRIAGQSRPLTGSKHIQINPGVTVEVFLTPKTKGEFPMVCFIPMHRHNGMVGTIAVDEAGTKRAADGGHHHEAN